MVLELLFSLRHSWQYLKCGANAVYIQMQALCALCICVQSDGIAFNIFLFTFLQFFTLLNLFSSFYFLCYLKGSSKHSMRQHCHMQSSFYGDMRWLLNPSNRAFNPSWRLLRRNMSDRRTAVGRQHSWANRVNRPCSWVTMFCLWYSICKYNTFCLNKHIVSNALWVLLLAFKLYIHWSRSIGLLLSGHLWTGTFLTGDSSLFVWKSSGGLSGIHFI